MIDVEIQNKSVRFRLRQFSIAFIISGTALGMYFNFFIGNFGWNNIIMAFSILFLPNWAQLKSLKLPSFNINYGILLFFQLLCMSYLALSKIPPELSKGQLYIFHMFVVSSIISFMSLRMSDLDLDMIVRYSWLLTFSCTIFCFISCVSGIYYIENAKTHGDEGYQSILSSLTMSGACVSNIICSMILKPNNKFVIWCRFLSIVLSIVCLFLVGKRTPLLVSLLAILIYIWRTSEFKFVIKKKYIKYIFAGIVGLGILLSNEIVWEPVWQLFERSFYGIHDMIYGTSKSGDAAVMRFEVRQWAFDLIDTKFNLFNYIFGYGYMTRWLDNPVLQAYLDMGLLGFSVYLGYVIIYPTVIMFSKISRNRFILFACLLNCYNIFSAFNSGHPYGYTKWWSVIFLIFVVRHCYVQHGKTDYCL